MSEQRVNFRVAVFVIVRNDAGEVLLQQRAGTDFLPGYYDFPSGHVEKDESLIKASIRELEEETTLRVKPADLELVHINHNVLDRQYINFIFEAQAWIGAPAIGEPYKCSGIGFFSTKDLPEKCSLSVRLMQQRRFKPSLKTSFVDLPEYEKLMGEKFQLQ